jgi:hypothetical protein
MKRVLTILAVLVLAAGCAWAQFGLGGRKDKGQSQFRELTGQVLDANGAPLDSAMVYLKNTRSLAIKTYITEKDGKYRFPALAQNVDYDLYAERQGKKSDKKTLSAFDSRTQVTINLKIDTGKN